MQKEFLTLWFAFQRIQVSSMTLTETQQSESCTRLSAFPGLNIDVACASCQSFAATYVTFVTSSPAGFHPFNLLDLRHGQPCHYSPKTLLGTDVSFLKVDLSRGFLPVKSRAHHGCRELPGQLLGDRILCNHITVLQRIDKN